MVDSATQAQSVTANTPLYQIHSALRILSLFQMPYELQGANPTQVPELEAQLEATADELRTARDAMAHLKQQVLTAEGARAELRAELAEVRLTM